MAGVCYIVSREITILFMAWLHIKYEVPLAFFFFFEGKYYSKVALDCVMFNHANEIIVVGGEG